MDGWEDKRFDDKQNNVPTCWLLRAKLPRTTRPWGKFLPDFDLDLDSGFLLARLLLLQLTLINLEPFRRPTAERLSYHNQKKRKARKRTSNREDDGQR